MEKERQHREAQHRGGNPDMTDTTNRTYSQDSICRENVLQYHVIDQMVKNSGMFIVARMILTVVRHLIKF